MFNYINKIPNPHHRKAVYGVLSLHGIFFSLVAIKTLMLNVAGLKAFSYGSLVLMSIFNLVPHVALAAEPDPIDYSISNSVYPMFTQQGEMAIHMIYYQNDSVDSYTAGSNVVVSVNIPDGMSYVSNEGPKPTTRTDDKIVWNISNSESRNGMIILRYLVDPDAAGQLKTTATVSSDNPDPISKNNTADAIILAGGGTDGDVDLVMNTTVNRSTATIFDTVDFTMQYVNNGPDTAVGVKIYNILPPELRIRTMSRDYDKSSNGGNIYTRDIGTLEPGESGSIAISASIFPIVENGNKFTNTMVISSNMIEENGDNNTKYFDITVEDTQSDMYVDIFAPKQSICIGDDITFTINLGNQGLGTANNISLKHNKPNTLTYVSSSNPAVSSSGGVYTRSYNTPFTVGDSTSFTMTLKGYDMVVGGVIPIILYESGVQVAQDTFNVTVLSDEMCNRDTDPDPVYGCMDKKAENYNKDATHDDNSCTYPKDPKIIYGCMDKKAENYNKDATHSNDSCSYLPDPVYGCMDKKAENYKKDATHEDDSCTYTDSKSGDKKSDPVYGCTSFLATNYNKAATHNDKSCIFVNRINGCTNAAASNYNPKATVDNGSCKVAVSTTTESTTGTTATITTTESTTGKIIVAKPSEMNFFVVNPSPKKTTKQPLAQVKKLAKNVSAARTEEQIKEDKKFEEQLLSAVKCESTMVEIYNYASDMGLITKYDIENLCEPIERITLAKIMVNYMLKLAIIEPSLKNDCRFDDLAGLPNEKIFEATLACDFRIMGVDDNNNVLPSFNPNGIVTKAEAAKTLAKFVFGDSYKKPMKGQPRYGPSLNILQESYILRDIKNPEEEMKLGQVLLMLMRADYGDVFKNTKYYIQRNPE